MERVYDYIESNIDSQFTMKELVREISKYWHDITDEKPPTQLCVQERLKKKYMIRTSKLLSKLNLEQLYALETLYTRS